MQSRVIDAGLVAQKTVRLFRQGRRTVAYSDLEVEFGRQYDSVFVQRIVDLLPDAIPIIEAQGIPVCLVNSYCLRHFKEAAVSTPVEAQRCTKFRAGGKPPVGIRQALPDDLVRAEENGCQVQMANGLNRHAVQRNANDVARGISVPETQTRLVSQLCAELPKLAQIQPELVEATFLPADDE
jgi:hypothetical protein